MVECDACGAVLENGDAAIFYSDGLDELVFCSESCAVRYLCEYGNVEDDEEDFEDFDWDEDEEDEEEFDIDLGIFG